MANIARSGRSVICFTVLVEPHAVGSVREVIMQTANEFIARFITTLERRERSTAASAECLALVSDVLPPQTRVMASMAKEICPNKRCSDVDRAIIGASLGG